MIRIAHELKSKFAQTAAAENPTKITPSSAWLMENKIKGVKDKKQRT